MAYGPNPEMWTRPSVCVLPMAAFPLQKQRGVVGTETEWSTKPEISTSQLFTEKFVDPCPGSSNCFLIGMTSGTYNLDFFPKALLTLFTEYPGHFYLPH